VLAMRGEGARFDPAAAVGWFERAAHLGDRGAQRRLGRCYATGFGVASDTREAFKWLTLASDAGDDEARQLREELDSTLSARDRWEGRVRARSYALARDID